MSSNSSSNGSRLRPGEHLIVFGDPFDAFRARALGLEFRDTIAHLHPGGWESIFIFRQPLDGTVVDNVLTHGLGGLNIDAARIYTDWDEPDRPETWKRAGYSPNPGGTSLFGTGGMGIECHPKGRWPTNLVFTHSPHCRRTGTKKVKGSHIPGPPEASEQRTAKWGFQDRPPQQVYTDEDGTETVAAWKCVDECPIKKLDDMSGDRRVSGTATTGAVIAQPSPGYHGGAYGSTVTALYDDFGTASRYYPQFANRQELLAWLAKLVSQ
jgi:hypothetical protein